jgi:hypothetical protein
VSRPRRALSIVLGVIALVVVGVLVFAGVSGRIFAADPHLETRSENGVTFVVDRGNPVSDAVLYSGRLVADSNCLYVEVDGQRYLAVLRDGFSVTPGGVRAPNGHVVDFGDSVEFDRMYDVEYYDSAIRGDLASCDDSLDRFGVGLGLA